MVKWKPRKSKPALNVVTTVFSSLSCNFNPDSTSRACSNAAMHSSARRHRMTTLWSTGNLVPQLPFLHHAVRQPATQQAQDPSVLDDLPDQPHQDFPVNLAKEIPNVQIHHMYEALLAQRFHPLGRRPRTAVRTEPWLSSWKYASKTGARTRCTAC